MLDNANNIVTSANSIALGVNGGVPTLGCTTNPMPTTGGVATFAGCNLIGADATYTLHATNGFVVGDSGSVVLGTGPATHIAFTNAAFEAATNGAPFAPQPAVTVLDAGGNTVTSVNTITVSVNEDGATIACTNNSLATASGIAAFAACNLTGTDATYTLHATNGTFTANSGSIVLGTGLATQLLFTNTAFAPAVNGTTLAPQPQVTVADAGGNTVTNANSITLSVNGGAATANCTTNPMPTTAGVATFAGCNLTGPANTYTLHATNGTVVGNSGNVVLAAFGAASRLVFTNAAFGPAVNGAQLAPQPQVTVKDAGGNTVTTASTITLDAQQPGRCGAQLHHGLCGDRGWGRDVLRLRHHRTRHHLHPACRQRDCHGRQRQHRARRVRCRHASRVHPGARRGRDVDRGLPDTTHRHGRGCGRQHGHD